MRFTIILIFVMLLAAACHEKHDARLDGLEELMATAPDSALTILEELPESTLATDFDKARHAMLLMMVKDKCYLPLQPDSNLLWANEVFHRRKDIRNEMKSRYYAGLAYRHIGEYRDALWEALNAIDLSHEAADTFWMGKSHDLAYEIYSETYDYHNAAIEADKAAIYFKKAGAEASHRYALLEKTIALNNPVNTYTNLPSEEGGLLLDSLIDVFKFNNDNDFLADGLLQKGTYLHRIGKYEESVCILDTLFLVTKDSFYYVHSLPLLISNGIRNNEDVSQLLKDLEYNSVTRKDTINLLHHKKKFAIATQDWHTAALMADSIVEYAERILGEKSFSSIDEIKSKYQNSIVKRKEQENLHLHKRNLLTATCLILLLIAFVGVYVYIRKQAKRKENATMNQLLDIIAEREFLRKKLDTKENVETENKNLKAEIASQKEYIRLTETQTKELDRIPAIEVALRREGLLGNRIDTLCILGMEYYDCEANPRYKNDVYNRIKKEIDTLRSKRFQQDLTKRINSIHSDIIDRMKEQLPSLAKSDLTWVAMLIGGFQPNTICFLLNLNKNTFYSQRRRLKTSIENSSAPDKMEFLIYLT